MRTAILAAIFFALLSLFPAQSKAQLGDAHFTAWDRQGATTRTTRQRQTVRQRSAYRRARAIPRRYSPAIALSPIARIASGGSVVSHPPGCPRRLFCGCGASIEVFGRSIRHLWLASNWLKFPPAQPGPGMVAANRRHVMVIRQMVGPNTALVFDANSGGGKTRVHVRSLAGYSIRNPRT